MKLAEYKKHPLIISISNYCKANKIKFSVNYQDGDYFDSNRDLLHLSHPKEKLTHETLSYYLFIAAHEYGHVYQHINHMNVGIYNDIAHFDKMISGDNISRPVKKRVIACYLAQENCATDIGLKLLKTLNLYPDRKTYATIMQDSNYQLISYYIRFNWNFDVSLYNIVDYMPKYKLIPMGDEFCKLAQVIKNDIMKFKGEQ